MCRARAVTLFELIVVILFVGVGYVGLVQLVGHALRLSERAQLRSELTALALTELEHLRAEAATHPGFRPTETRALPGSPFTLHVAHAPAADGALMAIEVTARWPDPTMPLEVTLTGWVASGEKGQP